MKGARNRTISVDAITTSFWEAGDPADPKIVLLHGGEFGACAELAWEETMDALAERFHVIAPDMIGFGRTDKIVEFGLPPERRHERRIRHIAAFVRELGVTRADFVGNSMGGALLLHDAAAEAPLLPARRLVCITAGPATEPEAAAVLRGFDGSTESMRAILGLLFHADAWRDDAYVRRRLTEALRPGAFEAAMSARLRAPELEAAPAPIKVELGYERIAHPVLLVTGRHERCAPHWGPREAERIPNTQLLTFEHSAHCAHLEEPAAFNAALLAFLRA